MTAEMSGPPTDTHSSLCLPPGSKQPAARCLAPPRKLDTAWCPQHGSGAWQTVQKHRGEEPKHKIVVFTQPTGLSLKWYVSPRSPRAQSWLRSSAQLSGEIVSATSCQEFHLTADESWLQVFFFLLIKQHAEQSRSTCSHRLQLVVWARELGPTQDSQNQCEGLEKPGLILKNSKMHLLYILFNVGELHLFCNN